LTSKARLAQKNTSRVLNLDEVIITLNKFQEKKKEQPIQTFQIRKKDIEFQNAGNAADLLMNTGNVFIQKSQGGGGSPVLRRFEASRALMVIEPMSLIWLKPKKHIR
jgi:hemoglobin/transferrin/lactoferrin receptor protein